MKLSFVNTRQHGVPGGHDKGKDPVNQNDLRIRKRGSHEFRQETSRRTFLKATTFGASALIAAPAVLRGASPTADPVRVGHIGTGHARVGSDQIHRGKRFGEGGGRVRCLQAPPAEGREGGRQSGCQDLPGLPGPAGRPESRSGHYCHAGSLARADAHRRLQRGQGRLLREGMDHVDRRGQADARGDPQEQDRHAIGPSGAAVSPLRPRAAR